MRRKVTLKQKKQICEEYLNGMTPLELSLKYGISTNGLWYLLNRNGVPRGLYRKDKSTNKK